MTENCAVFFLKKGFYNFENTSAKVGCDRWKQECKAQVQIPKTIHRCCFTSEFFSPSPFIFGKHPKIAKNWYEGNFQTHFVIVVNDVGESLQLVCCCCVCATRLVQKVGAEVFSATRQHVFQHRRRENWN